MKLNYKSTITILLFLLIFVLGFFLRAQEVISKNYLFLIDQGRDMMDVRKIVFDYHLTLIGPYTSLGGVFQGPIWYYLLAIPTFITRGDPYGGLVLMLLLSLANLIVIFYWVRKRFGDIPALIASLLFAVSPEAIAAATFVWNPHPMWNLITLYIIFLYETVYSNKKFHILLWLVLGLMFHFEAATAVFIVVATIIYLLIFHRNLIKNKYFLMGIIIFGLLFTPQIIFEIRHDFLMTKSVLKIFSGSNQGLFVGGEDKGYVNLLWNHWLTFKNNFYSSFIHEGKYEILPKIIFILSLIIYFFSKKKTIIFSLLIIVVTIIYSLSFIYPFPIRYWFLTGFQSFYLIAAGILIGKIWRSKIGKVIIVSLVFAISYYSVFRLDILYFHPPDDGGGYKIKGKISAIDYIYHDSKDEKFGLLIFTPPVYTYAYDYLLWWYGQKKYNYLPHHNKKGIVYLLMEQDPDKPWSYRGWMETVIKTGKILETKQLPSGLIVQKRYF